MNAGCKLKLEWVPEAYKARDDIGSQSNSVTERQPLSDKSLLYGHSVKKYLGKQPYPKK